jgi:hypothetical protein
MGPRNAPCELCQGPAGTGRWGLCSDCRSFLSERSRERLSQLHPPFCIACQLRRPVKGKAYCTSCLSHYEGGYREGQASAGTA